MRNSRLSRWVKLSALAMLVAVGAARSDQASPPPAPAVAAAEPRRQLFVAIYERGTAWDAGKSAFEQVGIQEHMAHLRANGSALVGAAPFEQGIAAGAADRVVGMVIVLAANQEEAQAWVAADPAISGKLMQATVRHWLADRVKPY